MSRGDQVSRVLELLELLNRMTGENRPVTVSELCKTFHVSRPTIYRDLDLLSRLGVTVETDENGTYRSGVRLARPYNLPARRLGFPELLALTRLRAAAAVQTDPDAVDRWRGLDAFMESLPSDLRALFHRLSLVVAARVRPGRRALGDATVPQTIIEAFLARRPLEICYYSPRRQSEMTRTFHVYDAYGTESALYIDGHCTTRRALRTLAVNRVTSARPLPGTYQIPSGYDPAARRRRRFGVADGDLLDVRLLFSPTVAFYATERTWHESQRSRPRPDGSVEIAFEASGLDELTSFVLGWGGDVEVLGPAILRDRVHDAAQKILTVNTRRSAVARRRALRAEIKAGQDAIPGDADMKGEGGE